MSQHDRFNEMVSRAFFDLHQEAKVTHGLVMNLYTMPGTSDVVFPVYGASGGIARNLVYYLIARVPELSKGHAVTNAVLVKLEDSYEDILRCMGTEMARIQGFVAAAPKPNGEPDAQPRITNLDGGDMGIPWKANQTSHEAYLSANPEVAKQLDEATQILHRMNEAPPQPEPSAGLAPEVKHCECGAQRGELHFQYCPMWEETHATEAD